MKNFYPRKFRKKPVVVEAIQYKQGLNSGEILSFATGWAQLNNHQLSIATAEGIMAVAHNDWVIKGVKGEFYPCDPAVFELTYEEVTDDE